MNNKKSRKKTKQKNRGGKKLDVLTNEQGYEWNTNFLESSLTKYTKFIKDAYNSDPGYPLLGISLKEVIRKVLITEAKYVASEMFILALFAMTEKLETI